MAQRRDERLQCCELVSKMTICLRLLSFTQQLALIEIPGDPASIRECNLHTMICRNTFQVNAFCLPKISNWKIGKNKSNISNFHISTFHKPDLVSCQVSCCLRAFNWKQNCATMIYRMSCRDSSVGRASDWRSEGPRFDPGSRHFSTKVSLTLWPSG